MHVFPYNEVIDPIIHVEIPQQQVVDDEQNEVEDLVPHKRSERPHKPTKPTKFKDYYVYLQEHQFSSNVYFDPNSFQEAISSSLSSQGLITMEDKLVSMEKNSG